MINWNWFKKKKKEENLIEYSFIWYKRMENGKNSFYTKPFRTKVKAKNYDEAKQKVVDFALRKMELVIVSEDKFGETDLSQFEDSFNDLKNQMDDFNNKIKKHFNK